MTELMADDVVGPCLEPHRAALTAHCHRILGSAFEADDAVQETMVRAWRSYHRFEGRSTVRSWLHRIATNVCFDMLKSRQRRPRPMDPTVEAAGSSPATADRGSPDPADQVTEREDIRLAFVAALLHLPPKQRSVLLLCEVLRWPASDVAELLDTSVASVNSALQRARATLAEHHGRPPRSDRTSALDADQRALVHRYAEAFARHDVPTLVALLR